MPDTDVPRVSVIVPVFNDPRVERCLAALEAQTYPAERYEVLLVDNGSEPPVAFPPDRYPHLRLIREDRAGPSQARTTGLAHARGDVLAFTDADCIPLPTWLAAGVARLDSSPECGLLGGRIELVHDETGSTPGTAALLSAAMHLKQDRFVSRGGWAVFANAFSTRRVVDRVGTLDPAFISSGEIEWAHRVAAAGFTIAYTPDAVVQHSTRTSIRALCRRTIRLEMAWVQLRARGIGRGARQWVGQYLIRPLQATYTDVLRHRELTWSQKAVVGTLSCALVGYRIAVYALARAGWREDTRRHWG